MKKILSIILLVFSISVASMADGRGDSRMIDAVQAYSDGNFRKAAEICGKILSDNPGNDAALYYRGLSALNLGDSKSAIEDLRKAVAADSTNYWYQDRLALAYTMTSQKELAIATYENLLGKFPGKTDPYYTLLNLYYADGQADKTLETLTKIENVMGKTDQTVMTRYRILLSQKKQEEAAEALKDYVKEYSSPYVLTMLGDQEISMYNDSTAIAYYDKALDLDSDYIPARIGKAEVYRMTRHYPEYFSNLYGVMGDEAVPSEGKADYLMQLQQHTDQRFFQTFRPQLDTAAQLMVDSAPEDTTALQSAAFYYYGTDRQEKALEIFKGMAEKYPSSYGAAIRYTQTLVSMNKYEELAGEAESAAGRFPGKPEFYEMANYALYNLKEYDKVIENCRKAIASAPADSATLLSSYSTMGDMYHDLGKGAEAYKYYDKALRINPDYAPVLNNYAYYLSLEGKKLPKAAKMGAKAVEAEPDNATYLDTYGWILHLQGKDQEAKTHFKHAMLYGGKESAVIMKHYARVLEALGEKDLAEVYRDQAEKL